MIKDTSWPPPDWTSVKLSWDWCMKHYTHNPNEIYHWVLGSPGGRFHISGSKEIDGFDYRFEDPADATWFSLNLPK